MPLSAISRRKHIRDDAFGLDLGPAEVTAGDSDAWAMESDRIVFGWVVNPLGVANESFTVAGLADGEYDVRLYRTWRGEFLEPRTVRVTEGKLTVTIPELRTTGGHARHIGNDVAFKIVPQEIATHPSARLGRFG